MPVLRARIGGAWVDVPGGTAVPASYPRGYIGHAGQSGQQTGIGSTMTDLTGCTVTWTATNTRLYRISLILPRAAQNTTTAEQRIAIRNAANANLVINTKGVTAGQATDHNVWTIVGNLTGSQTVKASILTGAGTLDTTVGFLAVILVEDVGGT